MKLLRWIGGLVIAVFVLIAFAWSCGAVYYDGPAKWLAAVLAAALLAVLVFVRPWCRKLGVFSACFALVLVWWFTLKPSNDRPWQPDVAQPPWAEIAGDTVTLHNVRNCDYRTETDYTPHWDTRTVRLSQLTGIDMAINYWGSPWMAHPIVSFQFADVPPVCFSIETRKEVGESYSAVGGIYRQYELTYVCADERDVIRVRTNFRKGEDVYLYRLTATPEAARQRFLEYAQSMNNLRAHPRWYNAITTNCTTSIRDQHPAAGRIAWDWRLLLNGKADELMFEQHTISTGGLAFGELKPRSLINERARSAGDSPDFSARIRSGAPGFGEAAR